MMARPSDRRRAGQGREAGFTMVELMVALTVMTIGVLGAVGVFNSAFSVAAQASIRSRAVAVATRHIEAVRAIPYDKLVVSPTVKTDTQSVGGATFTVLTAITSADAQGVPSAYKQATVTVTWSDLGGTHAVDQATIIYPGGRGPHASATSTTTSTAPAGPPPAPTPFTAAAPPPETDATTAVDLTWGMTSTTDVSGFSVRYVTGGTTVVVTESLPATSRTLRVTGLSAGTAYSFQISAKSIAGTSSPWSSTGSITTATATAGECAIGTPSIDPPRVAKGTGGQGLTENPVFSVNTSGSCVDLSVVYRPSKTGADVTRTLLGSSGLRTRQLDESGFAWDPGTHFVDLFDGSGTKRATVKLTVCEKSKACK